jgi:amino acid adenylation domain-containing protein
MEFINRLHKSITTNKHLNAFFIDSTFYTYNDLSKKISSIRKLIQDNIPETEKLIGLLTNDDLSTYATIIGLWFEGKAYVPINPQYPIDRNLEILSQTNSKYLFDSSSISNYEKDLCVLNNNIVNDTKLDWQPPIKTNPEDLAYILFTSGSTGKPKGVPITFKNLNGLVKALDADKLFNLNETDRCLQMFELTFDFSLVTYLPPLLFGACVYTIPQNTIKYFYIFKLIKEQQLTVLTMVPSIIHYLRPYFSEINSTSVRYCSFGGGKLHADIAEEWSNCIPNSQIFNYYGPTEFTVYSGYYPYHPINNKKHNKGIISIGKPLDGVQYLIVDKNNEEVPLNCTGELCLAGVQTTPGYWKDEERNKTSFFYRIENNKPVKYYKTGDLCYLDDEGDYMYVGRADFQVKVRGYRVELGEIEFHAKEFTKNTTLVAIDIKNDLDNTELALAIVGKEFDTTAMVKHLKNKLPSYMIPTRFHFFSELPHNVNGKVDRKKLRVLLTK